MKLLTPELLILAQMCTKSFVGPHSAPPDPLAALRGPTSKGRGGVGRYKGKGRVGREGERKGGDGREGGARPHRILGLEPPLINPERL